MILHGKEDTKMAGISNLTQAEGKDSEEQEELGGAEVTSNASVGNVLIC